MKDSHRKYYRKVDMCDVMLAKIRFGSQVQSRQSTLLFLQSSKLGPPLPPPPQPHPQASVSPLLWFRGDTLACGRWVGGGFQFARGDRHCGTLGIYVSILCGFKWPGFESFWPMKFVILDNFFYFAGQICHWWRLKTIPSWIRNKSFQSTKLVRQMLI